MSSLCINDADDSIVRTPLCPFNYIDDTVLNIVRISLCRLIYQHNMFEKTVTR